MTRPEVTFIGPEWRRARRARARVEARPCSSPTCEVPGSAALPGRRFCGACAERLEALAGELRRSVS